MPREIRSSFQCLLMVTKSSVPAQKPETSQSTMLALGLMIAQKDLLREASTRK